ncbi:hypothetical protein [Legionella fairfieldensis]|uniref:hypothetical protein n=1 Tax=Legionella fairfieldensis TaxID=45064 RepID=UPI00048C6ED0|nr:hypothetical protein [Legionella fairfieldensis]
MMFKVFNIPARSFLQQIQNALNKGVKVYNVHAELGGHINELSSTEYNSQRQIAERLLTEQDNNTSSKQVLKTKKHEVRQINYLKFNERYRNKDFWRKLQLDHSGSQDLIRKLEREWSRQASHSHFTVDALFESEAQLQEFQLLLKYAQQEAAKKQYRKDEALKSYLDYLCQFTETIKQEKEAIAEALYYRLKIAFSNKSVTHYNPTFYLLTTLHTQGINPVKGMTTNELLVHSEPPFPFAKAIAYIQREGSAPLQHALAKLLELAKDYPSALEVRQQGHRIFLIPNALSHYIPKSRFMSALFSGAQLRYQFFQNKTDLLIKLAMLYTPFKPPKTTWESMQNEWQTLVDLQKNLDTELQTTQQRKRTWFAFLFKKTNTFLDKWQMMVQHEQYSVTSKQLTQLKRMLKMPLPLNYAFAEATNESVSTFKQTMRLQLSALETRLKNDTKWVNSREQQEFQALKQAIITQWDLYDTQNKAPSIESVLFHLSTKPAVFLSTDKFALLEKELATQDSIQLETWAKTVEVERIALHVSTLLENLPSLMTTQSALDADLSYDKALRYLHQVSRVLSFFSHTHLSQSLEMITIHNRLTAFVLCYQNFIEGQTQDTVQKDNASLIRLEKTIHAVISIQPEWESIRHLLFNAEGERDLILKGQPAIDVHACLVQSQQEENIRREQLNALLTQHDILSNDIQESIARSKQGRETRKARLAAFFTPKDNLPGIISETIVAPSSQP